MKILVIEDHPKIRENIIDFLELRWHIADGAKNGYEWLLSLHSHYDVIILDVHLPEMDGKEFLKNLRKNNKNTPVLVLTSNTTIDDKTEMYGLGADDYLTKPFDIRELELRVGALMRRKSKNIETEIPVGDGILMLEKHCFIINGSTVVLTSKEYQILEFLARNKGFPKTKMKILEATWGLKDAEILFNSTTLEVHISSLRRKIGKNIIKTVKGAGYLIE